MLCKNCKRTIDDDSIYCKWCGNKQLRERKKKTEIKVPKPRQLNSGAWNIELRAEGQSITEDTPELCIAKARAIRAGFIGVKKNPDDITLREAIDKYISENINSLRPRSVENYEYIRDHRFQGIMDKKLASITSSVLNRAKNDELAKPSRKGGTLSPKTVNDALNFLLTVIRKYSNTAEDIGDTTLVEIKNVVTPILTPEEIYPAIKGTDIELTCLLAMWFSLSISEIRGLTKSKSIVNGKLYAGNEVVVDVKGKPTRLAGDKEAERARVHDIPPYIQSLIDRVPGDIIEPRTSHAVNERFKRCLANNGLPKMNFHKLRHVNASLLIDMNIPTAIIQERGGWKTEYVLNKNYKHTFSSSRRAADAAINDRFEQIIGAADNSDFTNDVTNAVK